MDRERLSRASWAGAIGIVIVVLVTLLSRGGGSDTGPTQVLEIEPDATSPATASSAQAVSIDSDSVEAEIVRSAQNFRFESIDRETGALDFQVQAAEVEPLPAGEFELKQVQFIRYLSAGRAIKAVADAGRLVAPSNEIHAAQMQGRSVITVYESKQGRPIDFTDQSPDLVLRIELDEGAVFDATQGQISGDGPVRINAPAGNQASLTGRGLRLIFNQESQPPRLDYLEIAQVDSLVFTPPDTALQRQPRGEKVQQRDRSEPIEADVQFYHLAFDQNIRVLSGEDLIEADRLDAYFALTNQSLGGSVPANDASGKQSATAGKAGQSNPASSAAQGRTIRIEGGGKLVMQPAEPPEQLTGPDDLYMKFAAEVDPLNIILQTDTRISADTVEYLDSSRRLSITGSQGKPLRVLSPELGFLASRQMIVHLDDQFAQLVGPGFIQSIDDAAPGEDGAAQAQRDRSLPPNFRIVWSNGVDLNYDLPAEGQSAQALLKSATFIGAVHVKQEAPDFNMKADQITVRFENIEGESTLRFIDAVGDVNVQAEQGDARADKIRVALVEDPDRGRIIPAELLAEGDAAFSSHTDGSIAAEFIRIAFAPKPLDKTAAEPPAESNAATASLLGASDAFDVTQIVARKGVHLMQEQLSVTCESLDADNLAGSAMLIGKVVIHRTGNNQDEPFEVHVAQLDVSRDDQDRVVAVADGPGHLKFLRGAEGDQAVPVEVSWERFMSFSGRTNLIEFAGRAAAVERQADGQVSRLTAERMTLELVDPEVARELQAQVAPNKPLTGTDLNHRQLRRLIAQKEVELLAYQESPGAVRQWTLSIKSPRLEYTHADERAIFAGSPASSMFIEDNRTRQAEQDTPMSKFSGSGRTLFQWTGELIFDKINGKMQMARDVKMTHVPAADQPDLEMRAQTLSVSVEDTDTVEALGMGLGSVALDNIEATGNVYVEQVDEVSVKADRINYDGSARTVMLQATPGRLVEIDDFKQPKRIRAEIIEWNLQKNAFEIKKVGF